MKKLLFSTVAVGLMTGAAHAGPTLMTDDQLDTVVAGFVLVQAPIQAGGCGLAAPTCVNDNLPVPKGFAAAGLTNAVNGGVDLEVPGKSGVEISIITNLP